MSPNLNPATPDGYYLLPERSPLNATSQALENSHFVAAGECRLFGFTVSSTLGAGQFIQLFDATSLPADTAVPILSIDIATVTAKGVYFGMAGRWFYRGIWICNSTTQATKTIGAANCLFDAQFLPAAVEA